MKKAPKSVVHGGDGDAAGGVADVSGRPPKRRASHVTVVRRCVLSVLFSLFVMGVALHTGWGTASAAGIGSVAALCPLGALEAMLGSWSFAPRLLIGLGITVAVALLFGRAFCSWACPVPPLSRVLRGRKAKAREACERAEAGQAALARWSRARRAGGGYAGEKGGVSAGEPAVGVKLVGGGKVDAADGGAARRTLDSRHVVLAGALGSAAVFGFPVFCLVCPVGLTFATVVLAVRLVAFNEPSWGLVAFPTIVVLELVVLRRWCGMLCPIGALLGLIGRLNRTFRPRVDVAKCLRTRADDAGVSNGRGASAGASAACAACSTACPEHIDPRANLGNAAVSECTRCHRCADACPAKAIAFPLMKR